MMGDGVVDDVCLDASDSPAPREHSAARFLGATVAHNLLQSLSRSFPGVLEAHT